MNRLTHSLLSIGIITALAACLFLQIVVIPVSSVDAAQHDPVLAHHRVGLVVLAILGLVCVEIVLVATWFLLRMVRADAIFTARAFRWVDVIIGAMLCASVLAFGIPVLDLVNPYVAGPDADDMGVLGLYLGGVALAGLGLGLAMLLVVLRGLLAKAVGLRDEMAEVI